MSDNKPSAAGEAEVPFGSNEIRLSPREWTVAAGILVALFCLIPTGWQGIEPLEIDSDYRLPFRLGYDYWTYDRYCGEVCDKQKTLLVGDSVIWGHYVARDETLSHHLNELAGKQRFVNLGVDGIHPAAMAGLVEHYGEDITGCKVIVNCNLLWMSSPESDLSTEKEQRLNHPELIPQFVPRIPCYEASGSERLGVVVRRKIPFLGWSNHLRIAYFQDVDAGTTDLANWTLAHPREHPARAITLELPSPDEPPGGRPVAKPWYEKGIGAYESPRPRWIDLDESVQWRFFLRTIEVLRSRDNQVFVLIGPFNEHMLATKSLRRYRQRQREIERRLRAMSIDCFSPAALPSEQYADASHPLAEGYELLAKRLFGSKPFVQFDHNGPR